MNNNKTFILTPITKLLDDMLAAHSGIGSGLETFPLSEYALQTTFLKMTGFQEQKMKCVCWEIATNNFDYRYFRFRQHPIGECSSYAEKQVVYKDLLNELFRLDPEFDINTVVNRKMMRDDTKSVINKIFLRSNLASWKNERFEDYKAAWPNIKKSHFCKVDNLFENVLQDKYDLLYRHRNRCAHNSFAYHENLPTLVSLVDPDHIYDNYFIRFSLLILIDKIFIELYNHYLKSCSPSLF